MSAAIGLNLGYASSFGLYVGLLATALTLLALGVSDDSLMGWLRIPRKHTVRVLCVSAEASGTRIDEILRNAHIGVERSDVTCVRTEEGVETVEILYEVDVPRGRALSGVMREIGALSGVRSAEAVEPPFYREIPS